jgi:SagB-type dehydrogenase family enzyme
MSLETFLNDLHFDIDKIRPSNWEVDWNDAPLAYKLYRGLPIFPLSMEIPLSLEGVVTHSHIKPSLNEFGHFLWYVSGLTQVCQSIYALHTKEQTVTPTETYRRFPPSGGALYPNECYVYLNIEDIPNGVYHYNVAQHSLILLREGNFDSYLERTLGDNCEISTCFGAVFVSSLFWKNFYKYNSFSYRLQGLDAGVLIGQLLEVSKRFGFESGVYFQFLDRAVNHLLGLSEKEESVYAVIPLSVDHKTNWFTPDNETISDTQLCQELETVQHDHYIRSIKVIEYPMLIKMNEASILGSTQTFRQVEKQEQVNCEGQVIALPHVEQVSYDLASVCRKRYSPGADFVLDHISQLQLATLLQETAAIFLYRNDLEKEQTHPHPRVSLVGCLYNVEGIPDGAYYYDSVAHALRLGQLGDHRYFLQQGMSYHNINLFQVPLCLHVIGDQDHLTSTLGYRGYRIQQMEAGMLVQRLLLTASSMGLGGHPLLGFDASSCDQLYKLGMEKQTSLIQIPVGPHRTGSRLEGSLHS